MDRIRCRICRRLHCTVHRSLSTTSAAVVPPRSGPNYQLPQTQSAFSPTSMVTNSSRQSGGIQHSAVPKDDSVVTEIPPASLATWIMQDNRELRHQNVDYKFLLAWYLHHPRSYQTPPPSACDEVDLALRRVVRHSIIMPPQVDENSSFEEMVAKLYDFYLDTS